MRKIVKTITYYDDGTYEEQIYYTSPMPSTPWNPSQPYGPLINTPKQSCPKCGITLDKVMGYCCPNNPCPTGLGGVYCSTET